MTERRDRAAAPVGGAAAVPVIEEAERHPAGARELAAARFATQIAWALNEAVRARGYQAKQLAAALGVGESAVSQVLNGDGNLRVATIGRYGRALGYQPKLVLEPVEPGLAPISEPPLRRRRVRQDAASPAQRVPLPADGWNVIRSADGATWGVQTTVTWPAPDRLLQESAYTRLDLPTPDPARAAGADLLLAPGGGS